MKAQTIGRNPIFALTFLISVENLQKVSFFSFLLLGKLTVKIKCHPF